MRDSLSHADELTPQRMERIQQLRRRLDWRGRLDKLVLMIALPAVLSLMLAIVWLVPLPVKAASLGARLAVQVCARATCAGAHPVTPQEFAATRVTFNGQLAATARRTSVTIVLQRTVSGGAVTVGAVWTRAGRVFNAQPMLLPTLFAQMGVTPQRGTTYRIFVETGSTTLTSTTVTLAR
ncbi:MAG: hypothetical protein M3Y74_00245 [Chloroflexota bacterium]|nr:hypothetical protein [Chloroflexota bacterium]